MIVIRGHRTHRIHVSATSSLTLFDSNYPLVLCLGSAPSYRLDLLQWRIGQTRCSFLPLTGQQEELDTNVCSCGWVSPGKWGPGNLAASRICVSYHVSNEQRPLHMFFYFLCHHRFFAQGQHRCQRHQTWSNCFTAICVAAFVQRRQRWSYAADRSFCLCSRCLWHSRPAILVPRLSVGMWVENLNLGEYCGPSVDAAISPDGIILSSSPAILERAFHVFVQTLRGTLYFDDLFCFAVWPMTCLSCRWTWI